MSAERAAKAQQQRQLVAALGYVFTPLVPALTLVTDMGKDEFLRRHAARALVGSVVVIAGLALVIVVMIALMRGNFLWVCLLPVAILLPFVPAGIWARRVYLDGDVAPPIITPVADRLFPPRGDAPR